MEPEPPVHTWISQCRNCGTAIINEGVAYCPNCGQPWKTGKKRKDWWNNSWVILLMIFGACGVCSAPFVAAGALWFYVPETRFYINIVLGVFIAWYIFGIILRRMRYKRKG